MSDDPITKMLPERILDVLQDKRAKIQFEELKNSLPEFSDLPDSDWYATIEDLSSDGVIQASLVRTGIDGTVRAAYNIGITKRGRTLAPENRVQNDSAAKASESDDRQFANLARGGSTKKRA